MLIGRSSMKEIVNLKAKLTKEFSMKDMGPRKKFLEWKSAERKEVAGDITSWVHGKVLKRFNMSDVKPVNIPLRGHFKLCPFSWPVEFSCTRDFSKGVSIGQLFLLDIKVQERGKKEWSGWTSWVGCRTNSLTSARHGDGSLIYKDMGYST